jgi:hypothetical protein
VLTFAPGVCVTQMVSVIRPQRHGCVLEEALRLERVHDPAHLRIQKGGRRKVRVPQLAGGPVVHRLRGAFFVS